MPEDHPQDHPAAGSRPAVGEPAPVVLLDVANVVGARPDGWWRDRAGAAGRVLADAAAVLAAGRAVAVVAVLEGRARTAATPDAPGLEVVLAPADGDAAVVEAAQRLVAAALAVPVVVVTADRGLRERLPAAVAAVGPRWWWALVEGAGSGGGAPAVRDDGVLASGPAGPATPADVRGAQRSGSVGAPGREAPLGAVAARSGFKWSPGLPRPDAPPF